MSRILLVLATVTLLLVGANLSAQEAGKVEILWRGHSFFFIKSSKGTVLALDPHNIDGYGTLVDAKGYRLELTADAVLMSHMHNDHNQYFVLDSLLSKEGKKVPTFLDGKKRERRDDELRPSFEPNKVGEFKLEKDGRLAMPKGKEVCLIPGLTGSGKRSTWNPVDTTIKDVHLRTVGTYHDDVEGLTHGKNAVFIVEVDGWRIAHLGDLGHLLSSSQVKEILKKGPIDVLMIPVGGVYTLNGREAKKVVQQLQPREYIIPMHYGTDVFDDILTLDEFLQGQPKEQIVSLRHNAFTLERSKRSQPQITIMDYRPRVKK